MNPDYEGQVRLVVDHGTIVSVAIDPEDGDGWRYEHFDHRCFWQMVEAEGGMLRAGQRIRVTQGEDGREVELL